MTLLAIILQLIQLVIFVIWIILMFRTLTWITKRAVSERDPRGGFGEQRKARWDAIKLYMVTPEFKKERWLLIFFTLLLFAIQLIGFFTLRGT